MKPTTRETAIFAMLGAVMYASKLVMELAPNIHLLGTFTGRRRCTPFTSMYF